MKHSLKFAGLAGLFASVAGCGSIDRGNSSVPRGAPLISPAQAASAASAVSSGPTSAAESPPIRESVAPERGASRPPIVVSPQEELASATIKVPDTPASAPTVVSGVDQQTEGKLPDAVQIGLNVTPFTTYFDFDADRQPSGISFANAYTRILILSKVYDGTQTKNGGGGPGDSSGGVGTTGSGEVPNLQYPIAHWYDFFEGEKYDLNLSAKVQAGQYQDTIPLATVGSSHGKDGTSAIRELTHASSTYPWFLIHTGGGPKLTINLAASESYQSGIAGSALQIALAAVKTVSPQSSVVTTLSANSIKSRADAVDTAIGKLFSTTLAEGHYGDPNLRNWSPVGGLNITLKIPVKDGDWNGVTKPVGAWRINLAPPKASVFSDWYICVKPTTGQRCKATLADAAVEVYKEANADDVLSFPLLGSSDGLVTIRSFILKQDAYTKSMSAFTGDDKADKYAADSLCEAIRSAVAGNDMNYVDANIVLWAMMQSMVFPQKMSDGAFETRHCKVPDSLSGGPGVPLVAASLAKPAADAVSAAPKAKPVQPAVPKAAASAASPAPAGSANAPAHAASKATGRPTYGART